MTLTVIPNRTLTVYSLEYPNTSYRWPVKPPEDTLDYYISFAQPLREVSTIAASFSISLIGYQMALIDGAGNYIMGDVVNTSPIVFPNNTLIVQQGLSDNYTLQLIISGGTASNDYGIRITATGANGLSFTRDCYIYVQAVGSENIGTELVSGMTGPPGHQGPPGIPGDAVSSDVVLQVLQTIQFTGGEW